MKRLAISLCAVAAMGLSLACRHLNPVAHYEQLLRLHLTAQEKADLVQYLKSL